jgi:hypothetical protein
MIWKTEDGWAKSLWSYFWYGMAMSIPISINRYFSDDFLMGGRLLSAVPTIVVVVIVSMAFGAYQRIKLHRAQLSFRPRA